MLLADLTSFAILKPVYVWLQTAAQNAKLTITIPLTCQFSYNTMLPAQPSAHEQYQNLPPILQREERKSTGTEHASLVAKVRWCCSVVSRSRGRRAAAGSTARSCTSRFRAVLSWGRAAARRSGAERLAEVGSQWLDGVGLAAGGESGDADVVGCLCDLCYLC